MERHPIIQHSYKYSRLYRIWIAMRNRCNNPNNKRYYLYGNRGIRVTELWDEYERFQEWAMLNGYSPNLVIDRIDNNKNYSPDNCRWVTYTTNNNNKRTNVLLTYRGETHTMAEWSRMLDIPYTYISSNHNNYTLEEIVNRYHRLH